jgi:hypothetical protein
MTAQQASTTCPGSPGNPFSSAELLPDAGRHCLVLLQHRPAQRDRLQQQVQCRSRQCCADGSANDVSINNVLVTADDPNQAQHMNFYAMGLGIDGTLDLTGQRLPDGRAPATSPSSSAGHQRTGRRWRTSTRPAVDDLWHATANGRMASTSARATCPM